MSKKSIFATQFSTLLMVSLLHKHKNTLLYAILMATLLFLLKWLEFKLVIINHAFEVYIGTIALVFTVLGIWLALKLSKPKTETIIVEKEVYVQQQADFSIDTPIGNSLNISRRELEVLQLMAEGLSNQEIASRLFVSLNTVKTHSSKIFEKMDVKRRTQAVEKAKRMHIIP